MTAGGAGAGDMTCTPRRCGAMQSNAAQSSGSSDGASAAGHCSRATWRSSAIRCRIGNDRRRGGDPGLDSSNQSSGLGSQRTHGLISLAASVGAFEEHVEAGRDVAPDRLAESWDTGRVRWVTRLSEFSAERDIGRARTIYRSVVAQKRRVPGPPSLRCDKRCRQIVIVFFLRVT